jgi:hypothetical protein
MCVSLEIRLDALCGFCGPKGRAPECRSKGGAPSRRSKGGAPERRSKSGGLRA